MRLRSSPLPSLAVLICLTGAGCVSHVAMTPEDRGLVQRSWTGRERNQFLRLSFYVTPFFGDSGKRLLTALPPDEVELIQKPNGETIYPGAVQRILPAGVPVEIEKVEFPTAYVIPTRVLYTPREQPWVYLRTPGDKGPPLILVLRPGLKNAEEAHAELERFLTAEDPRPILEAYSPPVREAIQKKQALADMSTDALERAWGYPERKKIRFQDEARFEDWTYPGNKRRAFLQDERLLRVEEGPGATPGVPPNAPPSATETSD